MTRPCMTLTTVFCLAAAGLGAQQDAPRVTRLGTAKSYGLGLLQATLAQLRFELKTQGYVIVLQLDPTGGITPMFPADSEPGLRPAGVHVLMAPTPDVAATDEPRFGAPVLETAAELARAGRAVRPPAAGMADTASIMAYWMVIVSDVPTSGREVRAQLESMSLAYRSVENELRALPAALVGSRTRNWSASWTAVR